MTNRDFSLKPYAAVGSQLAVSLTGAICRRGRTLALSYLLQGGLEEIVIPVAAESPARRHGLWEETCFEFFLAVKEARQYWEFNLSPAGDWNVYRFDSYRQGMMEETALASLPFRVQSDSASLRLNLEVDLAGLIPPDQALAVAIAAVLKLRDGATTYWALSHPGLRPDFHRRDGFLLAF